MGSEETATVGSAPEHSGPASVTARLAAQSLENLTASQARLPGSVMRIGRTRPSSPRDTIHEGILDHMLATQDELVEHARAVPAEMVNRPLPRESAELCDWLGEHTPLLDKNAQRAYEARLYRLHLEARLAAGEKRAIRAHRCQNCQCFSLQWYGEVAAAVCFNLNCSGEDGRPSRFTLQQIAAKAVEILMIRAAT
jgi:hypothetical protein